MNIKGVIFDFDGVIKPAKVGSQEQNFWSNIDNLYPGMYDHIDNLWKNTNELEMIKEWRRGNKTSQDICNYLSQKYHVPADVLLQSLHQSVKEWYLDNQLITFSQDLRNSGIKTAIFTEQMDVFIDTIIPYFKLSDNFDYIICSCEYHMLKDENDGKFIGSVASIVHLPMQNLLFIDDWDKVCNLASEKGAQTYLYKGTAANAKTFIDWFKMQYT